MFIVDLLGQINEKLRSEDILKPTAGNGRLHETSNEKSYSKER